MTRLQFELRRLYHPPSQGDEPEPAAESPSLVDPGGRVRAMALTLAKPADWNAMSLVWQAVQGEWSLPAPAIAVSGTDGYQLWFSLQEAVPVAEARAFLEALCVRHLGHIAPARIDLCPALDADKPQGTWHAGLLPVRQVSTGQWSAFVAPDLAPIFAETPWLDIPPSPEGQADLLSRLQSIKPADWQAALAPSRSVPAVAKSVLPAISPRASGARRDAERFLLGVMNDESVALALRIDAAKALLAGPSIQDRDRT